MRRRCFTFLCVLLLSLCIVFPAYAADTPPRLVDDANLLIPTQAADIEMALDEISNRHGMDIVIVTIPTLGEYATATEYADDYYDYNGYCEDGILFLVAMEERKWAISTAGYGITAFTDFGLETMEDYIIGRLSDGDYEGAFRTYADVCDDFITLAKDGTPFDVDSVPKEPFNVWLNLLFALGIGAVVALVLTEAERHKLKSVQFGAEASEYVRDGSVQLTYSNERFLYRNVTKTMREKDEDSGGSSTHTSSSGTSHGGSSGSF